MDYSTAYILFHDKHKLFASDRIFAELTFEMKKFNQSDNTHYFKFHVWQNSMKLRFEIDLIVTIITTLAFSWFLMIYNMNLTTATDYAVNTLKINAIPFEKSYS